MVKVASTGDYYESDGDVLVVNFTLAPLRLSQQPLLIGGLTTGAFLVYDALLMVVTTGGPLVAFLIIFVIGFVLVAGTLLWRRFRRQRIETRQAT
jgi:hypothetical protein